MPGTLQERPAHLIDVVGSLDLPAAVRLRDTLLSLDDREPVVLDFREVRELQDSALAFLASAINSRDRRVELRGLGEHHFRLLRYLGFGPTDERGDGRQAS
jgi:anti-anti-sigma regulatory factor